MVKQVIPVKYDYMQKIYCEKKEHVLFCVLMPVYSVSFSSSVLSDKGKASDELPQAIPVIFNISSLCTGDITLVFDHRAEQ